jgi:hypothetical protein
VRQRTVRLVVVAFETTLALHTIIIVIAVLDVVIS